MKPEKANIENYGTRMFCDRFDKPPTREELLEAQFKKVQESINKIFEMVIGIINPKAVVIETDMTGIKKRIEKLKFIK